MLRSMTAAVLGLVMMAATGCQSMTGKTAGESMSDSAITAKVQSKLTADRLSNFTRVDVDTERGIVNLSGVVPTAEQKARAAELTRQVEGVKRVNNNLQIEEPTKTGKLNE
ncbi:BON domain-containing protein [Candidatus Nitrospira bockiana]